MDITKLTTEKFKSLPLVVEGESKEVRYAGNGEVVIRLKPTIYSYTHNRTGEIPGSDTARLKAVQALVPLLQRAGIAHTYKEVTDTWILSQLVLQPEVAGQPKPFRPNDLTEAELASLPKAPPVEVVVKQVHSGTPKHRYYAFDRYQVRDSHPELAGKRMQADAAYPEWIVRFDWRNPMTDTGGNRLADEVLPEPMADWFIDTGKAGRTALKAFNVLAGFLETKGLSLWDICFFIAEDGQTMFGEVSPDCLRVRAANGSPLDKDVWRQGGSSENVLAKWQAFADVIKGG